MISNTVLHFLLAMLLSGAPLLASIWLLKKAGEFKKTPWVALSASAMVFTLSAMWVTKTLLMVFQAVEALHPFKLSTGVLPSDVSKYLELVLDGGIFLSISLLLLVGIFTGWLAWQAKRYPALLERPFQP